MATATLTDTHCYHCGTTVEKPVYTLDEKVFCCPGCLGVYSILAENNLCSYYTYNDTPGQTHALQSGRYDWLDEAEIVSKLIDYTDDHISTVTFYVPAIHCSSCIWLLEHLYKLNPAVVHSRIDFLKKEVFITFRQQELSFRKLVELLTSVGYEPLISLQDVVKEKHSSDNRALIKKIAVAGFCMGNVMMLSFPEYLGITAEEEYLRSLFNWLNLAFAVPVTFYSGRDFFSSARAGLKHRMINLDAPLALIITVLFLRSAFEIITGTGPGFTDTLTGLIFLLLMGRWVRERTYYHLSFNRDYRSYFPLAVTILRRGRERSVPIDELSIGDRMFIRNNEIIPADAILMKGEGRIDFSFVTGESAPVNKVLGEIVYAGGRQTGEAIELEVVKPVSQGYLTSLWNSETFRREDSRIKTFNDSIAKYFSMITLVIAFSSAAFWVYSSDADRGWNAFTAVLIVACPCVLALSTPFTMSSVLSIFDRKRFYLKNTDVVEQLGRIDTIVFDKTGTITSPKELSLSFSADLTSEEKLLAASLAKNSGHPLSREITRWTGISDTAAVSFFTELPGKGISGKVNGQEVRIGNAAFVCETAGDSSAVHLMIGNSYKGFFSIKQQWRNGMMELFQSLKPGFSLHLLSGDTESEKNNLRKLFPFPENMHFRQSPHDKLKYIKNLQDAGCKVMMLGDGLNDAGALKQSYFGVAVTDDINNFSPGCDAILDGSSMPLLRQFLSQSQDALKTIRMSFVISASYNIIGIWFAVQGLLLPLVAAILMPLSTVTILLFSSLTTRYFAGKNRLI